MESRWNNLSPGQTVAEIVRMERVACVDLRYCKNLRDDADGETEITVVDNIVEAEFATIYVVTDLGEAIAIHDFDFGPAGQAAALTCFNEILSEIIKWKKELMA